MDDQHLITNPAWTPTFIWNESMPCLVDLSACMLPIYAVAGTIYRAVKKHCFIFDIHVAEDWCC